MRRASKPDLSRMQGQQQQGAHSVAAARMQNNKDAGQQDDDKLQLAMTAVEDAGERLRLSIVLDVSRHQLERYITGAEAMGHEGSGRQRSGEVDRRRYAGIGKEREHASVGPAASGSHSYCATISPRTQGQQLRNLWGRW
jgi:hypothetical protein